MDAIYLSNCILYCGSMLVIRLYLHKDCRAFAGLFKEVIFFSATANIFIEYSVQTLLPLMKEAAYSPRLGKTDLSEIT